MKTQSQIYGRESSGILRDLSMYRVLTEEQLARLHPCANERERHKLRGLLAYLLRQQRLWLREDLYYCVTPDALEDMDRALFSAVWILADFIDRVEFHSVGDFPAKIIFFADGEVYEIVHAVQGKETLLSHILSDRSEHPSRYLVMVDDPAQIRELQLPNVCGYCIVSDDGVVEYFQKETEVES